MLRGNLILFRLGHPFTVPFGQVPPQRTYFGEMFVALWTCISFTIMHYSRVVFEAARVASFKITTIFWTYISFTIMHYSCVAFEAARVASFIITSLFLTSPPDSFMLSFPVGVQCAL